MIEKDTPATQEATRFTEDLLAFLKSKQEVLDSLPFPEVQSLIRASVAAFRENSYRQTRMTKGPCLQCEEQIQYSGISTVHKQRGDGWLLQKIVEWEPASVSCDRRGEIRINGFAYSTVAPYLCLDCLALISRKSQEAKDGWLKAEEDDRALKAKREQLELLGEVRASPWKRYRLLCEQLFSNPDLTRRLKAMPYKAFLATMYWKIIRAYVLNQRRWHCELCNSKSGLDVHHRTYEHHGAEHQHLEDLAVLCRPCHSRHHDKVHHEAN